MFYFFSVEKESVTFGHPKQFSLNPLTTGYEGSVNKIYIPRRLIFT